MRYSTLLKWITGSLEALLALPLLGGLIVISSSYQILTVALILHCISLALAFKFKTSMVGNIMGIVTALIAWIPILGWIMHVITCLILLVHAYKEKKDANQLPNNLIN